MCSGISTILKLVKAISSDPVKNHLKIWFWIFNSDVSFLILIAFFLTWQEISQILLWICRECFNIAHFIVIFFQIHRINRFILLYVRKLQLSFNMKFMTHFLPVSLYFFLKKTSSYGSGSTVFCICLHFKCNISFIFIFKYKII